MMRRCTPERHKGGAHGRRVTPHGAGPECAIGIAKDRNSKVSSRKLGLACRANGLDQEPRQVSPRPNPEPRDGHEGHELMFSPYLDRLLFPLPVALPRMLEKIETELADETKGTAVPQLAGRVPQSSKRRPYRINPIATTGRLV
jgi:hypothetical protein